MTAAEERRVDSLIAVGSHRELDALMQALHVAHHADPLGHVRVHRAWIRVHLARRAFAKVLGHLLAGYLVAAPASLLQKHTGLSAFR